MIYGSIYFQFDGLLNIHDLSIARSADAQMELETGGKGVAGRQNLIVIGAGAQSGELVLTGGEAYWEWGADTPVDPTQIQILGKNEDTNGNVYVLLPDGDTQDATPQVKGKDYYTWTGPSVAKYKSYFEVFVRMPYPPGSGSYDNHIGDDFGHAWWRLSTDAPADAINYFMSASRSQYLGQGVNQNQVGYGTDNYSVGFDFYSSWPDGIKITGPGKLWTPDPDSNTQAVYKKYNIGFNELINALGYTQELHDHPGTYNAFSNNCVDQTVVVGGIAGVRLPGGDIYPEDFGLDIYYQMPDDQ
jgi:hypothetical protein